MNLDCCGLVSSLVLDLFNRNIDEAVFLKLAFRVKVGHQKASLLILVRDRSHELYVHLFGKVFDILFEVCDGRVHIHLILPLILGPLEFEF